MRDSSVWGVGGGSFLDAVVDAFVVEGCLG